MSSPPTTFNDSIQCPTNPSASPKTRRPSMLPECPCEVCKGPGTYYCVNCDGYFCTLCWDTERPHRSGKLVDGRPHEKASPLVVNRLKAALMPPSDPKVQHRLHAEDEATTWFGVARDDADEPVLQDFSRYATLMKESVTGEGSRYPQLCSFVGTTGHGKSTLIKMLIDQKQVGLEDAWAYRFPTPIVGSAKDDSVPTTGDVHLYADPATFSGSRPLLYADCEGLDGGEIDPIGISIRHEHGPVVGSGSGVPVERRKVRKRLKMNGGQQHNLYWANTPESRKRQFAVHELYPRLLYTFSDVIVFVLNNAKTFQSTVLNKLLTWASASMEKSLNQPSLPHAIVVLNTTSMEVDDNEWDVNYATDRLMHTVADTVGNDPTYKKYKQEWTEKGKNIRNMKDLLECYYSSIRVVRMPRTNRYMFLDEQITKLSQEISDRCQDSYFSKRRARMLSNSDELHVYLQSAFLHFSKDLDTPFNFIEVAFKNNPIPQDFGGNILKLACTIRDRNRDIDDGARIFRDLADMVASCILLDCVRRGFRGSADMLLRRGYAKDVLHALDDFCSLFWPCQFWNARGRCVNVRDGHSKGHQSKEGRIIASGPYVSMFNTNSFEQEWITTLTQRIVTFEQDIREERGERPSELQAASIVHRRVAQEFYRRLGGAHGYYSHSVCFCCLTDIAKHPLRCGHILCDNCVKDYGKPYGKSRYDLEINCCPLQKDPGTLQNPWIIQQKPHLAGVRVLTLDGGGIRGIVELQALREIELRLGDKIRIQEFFDLIIGTSTGGIIALGLGVAQFSVTECIDMFLYLSDEAFTARPLKGLAGSLGTQYKTKPLESALKNNFEGESLFGGVSSSSRYAVKVAVTAATGTGERAVIFANYNRRGERSPTYDFIRPDNPLHELKIWEAARATSAAPTYFKAFTNRTTQQTYLDGALYHNNPARLADNERRLLWPDVEECHPDILLSLGTGHNGASTPGSVDRPSIAHGMRGNSNVTSWPKAQQRWPSMRLWLKESSFGQLFAVLQNRVENILNAEQAWLSFKSSIPNTKQSGVQRRYERINPNLGYTPPRLDEKGKLEKLSRDAREISRSPRYKDKIDKIAQRLVASLFYFERRRFVKHEDTYLVDGKIKCRFSYNLNHVRAIGNYLMQFQTPTFQPFFKIYETDLEDHPQCVPITPNIIHEMMSSAKFDIPTLRLEVSERLGMTNIILVLAESTREFEQRIQISGFPRILVLEDKPARTSTLDRQDSDLATNSARRLIKQRLSVQTLTELDERLVRLGISAIRAPTPTQIPVVAHTPPYPETPDMVDDWVSRRSRQTTWTSRPASTDPEPRSSESSSRSNHTVPSELSGHSVIHELDGTSVHQSPVVRSFQNLRDQQMRDDSSSLEEDEVQLRRAVQMSLQHQADTIAFERFELETAMSQSRLFR